MTAADRRLAGKTVLVTGSARGIGAAIARACRAAGAEVAVTYHESARRAGELAAELDALCLALDVASRKSVQNALETVLARWGRLDVLVNNAGWLQQEPFCEITDETWDRALDVNLKGVFLCTQAAAPAFERQRSGAVVNIASVGGQLGGPKAPHYSAAKAGVLSLTRSCARLFAPFGARVNAVAPGFVRTDMYADILTRTSEEEILAAIPLGRVGEPADVAAAVVWLASDEARFVTGAVLDVNGGQLMR